MDNTLLVAVVGFLGVLMGSLVSGIVNYFMTKENHKHELMKIKLSNRNQTMLERKKEYEQIFTVVYKINEFMHNSLLENNEHGLDASKFLDRAFTLKSQFLILEILNFNNVREHSLQFEQSFANITMELFSSQTTTENKKFVECSNELITALENSYNSEFPKNH